MTHRILKQKGRALRRCLTSRCAPVQCFTLAAILAVSAPVSLSAPGDFDETTDMEVICNLEDGEWFDDGSRESCCWTDWGCLYCSDEEDGDCFMVCETDDCCDANGACTTVPRLRHPVIGQLQPGDTLVTVDDAGQITLVGDDVGILRVGDRLVVEGDDGQVTVVGDVVGQYTPIGDNAEIVAAVAPDVQDEAPEPQGSTGFCGAGIAGSVPFGLLGLVGLVGMQRGGRYRRSAGRI